MAIPLVADTTKQIACDYGVLIKHLGIALRGLFIINPEVRGPFTEKKHRSPSFHLFLSLSIYRSQLPHTCT